MRKPFEGSKRDMREDKQLAAERGQTMKEWEASPEDEKYDRQRSMKGLHAVQVLNWPR